MTVDVINNVLENLRIDTQFATKLVNVTIKGPLLQKLKLWSPCIVFESPVRSGFLAPKQLNRTRTGPRKVSRAGNRQLDR